MRQNFEALMSRTYHHVVGWGTGNYFLKTVDCSERNFLKFLIDNDKSKWGSTVNGIPVFSPEKLHAIPPEDTLIIVFSSFFDEIVPAIESRGHRNYLPGHAWMQIQVKLVERELQTAIEADRSPKTLAALYYKLAGLLGRIGLRWQVIETLDKALALDRTNAAWYWELGEACETMSRFDKAVTAYAQAIDLDQNPSPNRYYRLGVVCELAGRQEDAHAAYAEAVQRHPSPVVQRIGVAFFHHRDGRPDLTIQALQERIASGCNEPGLHFRLGKAFERCFQWELAADAYRRAIGQGTGKPYWCYRLGFVCERLEQWSDAAEAYRQGLAAGRWNRPYWQYRKGVVLANSGLFEQACRAFTQALPETQRDVLLPPDPDPQSDAEIQQKLSTAPGEETNWYRMGLANVATGAWKEAAHAFEQALVRDDHQTPAGYYQWGQTLIKLGEHENACRVFSNLYSLSRPSLVPIRRRVDVLALYNEYRETLPIAEKTILYESFFDHGMKCNPYALFCHVVGRKEFKGWRHVWVIRDKSRVPAEYRSRADVVIVKRNSPLYLRYLATAKYLVNNVTFPYHFIRRPEQRYLNLWHGTPLKMIGKDTLGQFMPHRNAVRNFLHATHICSPNSHTSRVLIDRNDITGVFQGRLAEMGSPRIDLTLTFSEEKRNRLKQRLNAEPNDTIILYAPTWRGILGREYLDLDRLQMDIRQLYTLPAKVLFRGHHLTEKLLKNLEIDVHVVPDDIDTNELLSVVDILITDYSSIFFDFLPMNRPIVYYVYDEDEYRRTRGLYFSMKDLPGPKCRSLDELMAVLEKLIKNSPPKMDDAVYDKVHQRFCPHEDGQASERVANWFFFDAPGNEISALPDKKRSLLFYMNSFIPNGITSSALSLTGSIAAPGSDLRVSIVIGLNAVASDPVRMQKFRELPETVQVFSPIGRMNLSPEEAWVVKKLNTRYSLESDRMWGVYANVFEREFCRLFGETKFDSLIDFEGYSLYWSSLFAFAPATQKHRAIYQHNAMVEEWRVRFPYLRAIFELYRHFDTLVSVSESVCRQNRETLSQRFGIPSGKFVYCNNTINASKVLELAEESIQVPGGYNTTHTGVKFITVGRLSPEKGHEKLICAFKHVHNRYPDALLWIVGEGPLKTGLKATIEKYRLEKAVQLLGLQSNPYAFIRSADCFVLSSDYEGQGLVVLEAMILNCPVIATDVVGVRNLINEHHYGRLVENSVDGLANGMLEFIEKGVESCVFDVERYQRNAIKEFRQKALSSTRTSRNLVSS